MSSTRVEGIRPITLAFALILLLCMMLVSPAAAVDLPCRVNVSVLYNEQTPDYGYLNFSSIQSAINGVAEGGDVWVLDGTYNEAIVINRSMTVTTVSELECPEDHESDGVVLDTEYEDTGVIIDAQYEEVGVKITASDVTFSGFTVENVSSIGIYAFDSDEISIVHNTVAVINYLYKYTFGIVVENGADIHTCDNEIYVIGSCETTGIAIFESSDACVENNLVLTISNTSVLMFPEEESSALATGLSHDDGSISAEEEEIAGLASPWAIWIDNSSCVSVSNNRALAGGISFPDDPIPGYAVADAWGIHASYTDNLEILENDVTAFGASYNESVTVGISGTGNLALIQGNDVQVYSAAELVLPVGIRMGWAEKGQVLDNNVTVEAECIGMTAEEYLEAAGITAIESYKAQILRNDVVYEVFAIGNAGEALIAAEGIDIAACDASQVSENIVIVDTEALSGQTGYGEMLGLLEEDPSYAIGVMYVAGIDVEVSDDPGIYENVVIVVGAVTASDEQNDEEGAESAAAVELYAAGIQVLGDEEDHIASLEIFENLVLTEVMTEAYADIELLPEGVEMDVVAVTGNSNLQTRYDAALQYWQSIRSGTLLESGGLAAYLTEEDLTAISGILEEPELDPGMENIAFAHVLSSAVGIAYGHVYDAGVYENYVFVHQDVVSDADSVACEELDMLRPVGSASTLDLLDQMITPAQVQQALLLAFINNHEDEWLQLSEEDRKVFMDAILSGDAGVLAGYAANEDLSAAESGFLEELLDALEQYVAILANHDYEGFFNSTRIAVSVPVAESIGIYFFCVEDSDLHENNVYVMNHVIGRAAAIDDGVFAEDAAAGSAAFVQSGGIVGRGEWICITENNVTIETDGAFLTEAVNGEIEAEDAAAGTANFLLSVGIDASGYEEQVCDNIVIVEQSNRIENLAIETIQDEMALSVAATAGVAVGIVLDAADYLDLDAYDMASPPDESDLDDAVIGNTIRVIDDVRLVSVSEILLSPPLDGSSDALSAAVGLSTAFGIVAPVAAIQDNTVDVTANLGSAAIAVVEEEDVAVEDVGAANAGLALSGGIVTLYSYLNNNDIFTEANTEAFVVAKTEELLEDAVVIMGAGAVDIGIVNLGPSYINKNIVDGEASVMCLGAASGYMVDGWVYADGLNLGILTGPYSLASFNNINNGYIAIPLNIGVGEDTEYVYYPRASYNWWGDASGPSYWGPGTGSPVYGTDYYEPWLTRPYQEVLGNNKPYFGIELRLYDGLTKGWNTLSTPIALEDNTWHAIHSMGEGLNYSAAYTWDATTQRWVQVMANTRISPLDAVYVLMNEDARLPIAISPEITSPPVKTLRAGWNLIGPAYAFDADYLEWDVMKVDKALVSVEKTPAGLTGYTIALSPSVNPEAWSYTVGANKVPTMETGPGYWVYMENPDTLAGFSSTPLPLPYWAQHL